MVILWEIFTTSYGIISEPKQIGSCDNSRVRLIGESRVRGGGVAVATE